MKVKICGLTGKEDAVWALNVGADYLGFNFYKKSVRHIAKKSASWILELPSFASTVGIFVDEEFKHIAEVVRSLRLKGIQLHGNESVESIKLLRDQLAVQANPVFIIKGFRVKDVISISELEAYKDVVDYFLLDAYVENIEGGTGHTFDWNLALEAKKIGKPIFLAGGLSPDNVKDAISHVQPFAVDVASGVEKSPRKKDFDKMKQFIENAKHA